MKLPAMPFTVTDWSQVPVEAKPGETGEVRQRVFTAGDLRVRMVEYSPGYLADHWCDRGHVLFVLQGELATELKDGRRFVLKAGHSYRSPTSATPRTAPPRRTAPPSSSSIDAGGP